MNKYSKRPTRFYLAVLLTYGQIPIDQVITVLYEGYHRVAAIVIWLKVQSSDCVL